MKNYLKGGDLVELNKDIPNKPIMMVSKLIKSGSSTTPFSLVSIECIWFTETGFLQKEEFNFKDLVSLEEDEDERF